MKNFKNLLLGTTSGGAIVKGSNISRGHPSLISSVIRSFCHKIVHAPKRSDYAESKLKKINLLKSAGYNL